MIKLKTNWYRAEDQYDWSIKPQHSYSRIEMDFRINITSTLYSRILFKATCPNNSCVWLERGMNMFSIDGLPTAFCPQQCDVLKWRKPFFFFEREIWQNLLVDMKRGICFSIGMQCDINIFSMDGNLIYFRNNLYCTHCTPTMIIFSPLLQQLVWCEFHCEIIAF